MHTQLARRSRRYAGLPMRHALVLAFGAFALASAVQAEIACSDVNDLERQFLRAHISSRSTIDGELDRRTAQLYIERIDGQKLLFLAPEAKRLQEQLTRAARDIRNGNCTQLRALHTDLVARTKRFEDEVRAFVSSPSFAIDPNAEIVLDPDERGWPKTEADRVRELRAAVYFQMSGLENDGRTREEAKQRLIKRYELRTKRVREIEYTELLGGWLDAFASALDPHSNYLPPRANDDFQIQMRLSLEGIGVQLRDKEGVAVVEEVMPGSAAKLEGSLIKGDQILEVAQEKGDYVDVAEMDLDDIVRLIRGPKGTKVRLLVQRDGSPPKRFQIEIVRAKIDLEEQAAKLEFREETVGTRELKLGVLTLPGFYGGGDPRNPLERLASRDVRRLLEQARREQADGLVLDLAFNGGGLLEDAVRIAGFFIHDGGIVGVREGFKTLPLDDPEGGIAWVGPLVVLTSRVSASASEIVAGALKDYRRAVIVGDAATFGKGTVQTMLPRREGDALKVTTAMFFRPGGASTQHAGVEADVVLPSLLTPDVVGESNERFPLPSESVAPFLSRSANAALGRARWEPVTDKTIAELSRRSALRVSREPGYEKIREELAERAADAGKLKLATMIQRREKEEAEAEARKKEEAAAAPNPVPPVAKATPGGAPAPGRTAAVAPVAPRPSLTGDDESEEPKRPDLDEAVRVLADLVTLQPPRS